MIRTARGLRRAQSLALAAWLVLGALGTGCERRDAPPQLTLPPAQLAPSALRAAASASASATNPIPSAELRAECITPESVGAIALAEVKGDSAQEAAAVAAARRELKRVLEMPEDYFGSVQTAGDLVLLELWHRSAFQPGSCDVVQSLKRGEKPSTRCVKCRTVAYDPKLHRIVSTKVWEQVSDDAQPSEPRLR